MKKKFMFFIILVLFNGCVQTPRPQVKEAQNKEKVDFRKNTFIKKDTILNYQQRLNGLKYDEKQILESISLTIERYKRNHLTQTKYSDVLILKESINLLKIIAKEKQLNNFDINKIINLLKSQLKGKSWLEQEKIKEKISVLTQIKKERLIQREKFLKRSIEILDEISKLNPQKKILSSIEEFDKAQNKELRRYVKEVKNKNKDKSISKKIKIINRFKESQETKRYSFIKKIKKTYGTKEVLFIFNMEDTKNLLVKLKNNKSFMTFYNIDKAIQVLEKSIKIKQKNKYNKTTLIEIDRNEKNIIIIKNKDENFEEKMDTDCIKLEIIQGKIKRIEDLSEKQKKNQNNYTSKIDSSFYGKGGSYKVSKSNKIYKKSQQQSTKIKSNEYLSLNSIEELKNLKGIRTYVLFPKKIYSGTSNTETYKRYSIVLEYIQEELNKITVQDANEDSINNQHNIKTQKNRFVLFYEKKYDKKLILDNYNYKVSHKVLDIFKDKIKSDIFDNDGPFLITMNENMFDNEKGFEFIYIDLSDFNDSAIKEVINSYRVKLKENGLSDVPTLERFRLICLSLITTFSANIYSFSVLHAKD